MPHSYMRTYSLKTLPPCEKIQRQSFGRFHKECTGQIHSSTLAGDLQWIGIEFHEQVSDFHLYVSVLVVVVLPSMTDHGTPILE